MVDIGGYFIGCYWFIFLLLVINDYFINGYWQLLKDILLVLISGYLIMVVLLVVISGYFINSYFIGCY
jgi:hypothetical protein